MAAPTLLTAVLTGGSNSHQTTSEEVNGVATDFISKGAVGILTNTSGVAPSTGSFAVNAQASPDMTVQISTGTAYVTATPTSQSSQTLRVKCTTAGSLTISANSSGSTKYDWIYVAVSSTNAANPAVGADNVATIVASRSSLATSDDGTPPTYGTLLAIITVSNGASTITNGNIADARVRAASVGGINDTNGNEILKTSPTTDAVNEFSATNAATGNGPTLSATGSDSNIDININPKGTGVVKVGTNPITTGAWTAFTPTLSGLFANAKWDKSCAYSQVGKAIYYRLRLTANTTTPMSGAGNAIFTLPVTSIAYGTNADSAMNIGVGGATDDSANLANYATANWLSTTTGKINYHGSAGANLGIDTPTSSAPFAWTTGDEITIQGFYEAG